MVKLTTKFASPERSSPKEIKEYGERLLKKKVFVESINAFPEIVMFLDKNRQVVFCNEALLEKMDIKDSMTLVGKRPGEIFDCINAQKESGGCGTSSFCAECGAVKAILSSQSGNKCVEECRLTIKTNKGQEALDLRVWAVSLEIDSEVFTVFTLKDIGDEKRRELLQRTFFHDILNDSGIISAYSENMRDGILKTDENAGVKVLSIIGRMIDTIMGQRDLLSAEEGKLKVLKKEFLVFEFLDEIRQNYSVSKWGKDKEIVVEYKEGKERIVSDRTLLGRVMINLLKNALEASNPGDKVTIGHRKEDQKNIFYVNNPDVMDKSVQLQIFQRSFSTKGNGRGVGTYSVKLFTEQYLKGEAYFISGEDGGTTFFVKI